MCPFASYAHGHPKKIYQLKLTVSGARVGEKCIPLLDSKYGTKGTIKYLIKSKNPHDIISIKTLCWVELIYDL